LQDRKNNEVAKGKKHVTRSQMDYFGKGLQVLCSPFAQKYLLHANEFLDYCFGNLF